jgi:hypothetical protein
VRAFSLPSRQPPLAFTKAVDFMAFMWYYECIIGDHAMGRRKDYNGTIYERLSANLVLAENGCWEFTGTKTPKGYGRISFNGVHEYTHRVSWILHNGPIPKGLVILHSCDNPPCCNPEHLSVGTHKDNSRDMVRKGNFPSYHY